MPMIRIQPSDLLFFGGSRPRVLGEFGYFETGVLPLPSTFYGSLRGNLIEYSLPGLRWHEFSGSYREKHPGLHQVLGDEHSVGALAFAGPFLLEKEQPRFPLPANLFESDKELRAAFPMAGVGRSSLDEIGLRAVGNTGCEELERLENCFLSGLHLQTYLCGGIPAYRTVLQLDAQPKVARETRIGIGLDDDAGCAKEHRLFTQTWLRLAEPYSIGGWAGIRGEHGVDWENASIDWGGADRRESAFFVGGERKYGILSVESRKLPFRGEAGLKKRILSGIKESKRFLLYLATPGDFDGGWVPPIPEYWKGKANLLGAATEKAISYSGWEMKSNLPKPMRRAIPAGAVFFYEIRDGFAQDDFERLWEDFMMNSMPSKPEIRNAGFGITLLGCWNEKG